MSILEQLARRHKSDKTGAHNYIGIYEKYIFSKKNKLINLLEIGVGGLKDGNYSNIHTGGNSLKIWRDYFKKGKIVGLDIFEKKLNLGERVKIFQGSQSSADTLDQIIKKYKKFDFIIDDGSHFYKDIIFSFKYLFESLKDGGYYFIEDTQTSYLREWDGDGFFLKNNKTAVNYFKKIIDKINYNEIENPYYKPDYFAKNITEIHFYHNLIVVKKQKNLEKSTILVKNKRLVGGRNFIKLRTLIKDIKYFALYLRGKINYFFSNLKI